MLLLLLTLAAAAPSGPPLQVTFALQRPPVGQDGDTLLARLPAWEAAYRFHRYAVPLATPTSGGDFGAQLALLRQVSARLGRERVVAVTPPVGSVGWETSNNPGYVPLGGRPSVVATPVETWLDGLGEAPVGALALHLVGLKRLPTADELGAYLDTFTAGAAAHRQAVELWLPASLLTAQPRPPLLDALTPERLGKLAGLVWVDTAEAAEALAPPAKPKPKPAGKMAPEAKAETIVRPSPLTRVERLAKVLAAARQATPGALGADLTDAIHGPIQTREAGLETLDVLLAAGVERLVVRGRLDTPQAPLWRELLGRLLPAEPVCTDETKTRE